MNRRLVPMLALALALTVPVTSSAAQQGGDDPDRLVIDRFSNYATGTFPDGWSFMKGASMKDAREARRQKIPAVVLEEDGNRFLRIREHDDAHTLVRKVKWDLRRYPCVSWRWRVVQFPEGANERIDGSKDTAASLYVIFKIKRFLGIPRGMVAIRYLWSNVLPEGDWMERRGSERLYVMQTGTEAGVWVTETIDVGANYREMYSGKDAPKEATVIGLRTDANSTGTDAVADYDDIELLARCGNPEGSTVGAGALE